MKKIVTTILLAVLLPLSVYAAQIYGSLKEEGRAVPGVKLEVTCNGQTHTGETDGYGAYSVYAERGKCTFKVYHKGQVPTLDIYSYDNPVRYDFDLVLQNGVYALRRR